MSTEVVAVANHKGGVTKSFSAVSIAVGLALARRRVLLVDCDAQGNSTSLVLPDGDFEFDLHDVVTGAEDVEKVIQSTRIEGLDALPSTLKVARLDQDLIGMNRREDQIRRRLRPIMDRYDVIVLDLPPSLGAVVIAALTAATSIIVPTDPQKWGVDGVASFMTWVEVLRDQDVITSDLLGVLLAKDEPNTKASRDVVKAIAEGGWHFFETRIPKRTRASAMAEKAIVIGEEGADPDLTDAYGRLTLEVIARIDEVQSSRGRHARG